MAKQTFTSGNVLTAAQMTSLQQTAMGGGSATAKTASYVLTAADAGTTVIMNSASSTTITVNTALFSAGDTVNIQNIGAGVCTITAGTATVNTAGSLAMVQYEGGILYFVSASVATYFDYYQAGATTPLTTKGDLFGYDTANARIPIGTNNQVLTADSAQALGLKWATPTAPARSYSLLGTGTTTSGTTVTVSGISGINSLFILLNGVGNTTAGASFSLRLNADSSSVYAMSMLEVYLEPTYSPNSQVGNGNNNGQTSINMGYVSYGFTSANVFGGVIQIDGANSSGIKVISTMTSGNTGSGWAAAVARWRGATYAGTSAISSVSLIANTGAFNAGNFQVYGSA